MRFVLCFATCLLAFFASQSHADYSYQEAWQDALRRSSALKSSDALRQAADLNDRSVQGLGRPSLSLRATAIKYRQSVDVSLTDLKQNTRDYLDAKAASHLSQLGALPIDPALLGDVYQGARRIVDDAVDSIPDHKRFDAKGDSARASVSVSAPLYTGGLIDATKQIAHLQNQKSQLGFAQTRAKTQFELIKLYFDAKLQYILLQNAKRTYRAMELHVQNAERLEEAGLISKGQRMQFEVARNQALRLYLAAQNAHQSSQFQLKTLLEVDDLPALSSPLFIHTDRDVDWETLRRSIGENSLLLQQLGLDSQLAAQNANVQQAGNKPKVFATGDHTLGGDNDWFVGVVATIPLYSGINYRQRAQAAALQQQAIEHGKHKALQELQNLAHDALKQLKTSQTTHRLLTHNLAAAQENLRIQKLSFDEGMGAVSSVVDAQVAEGNARAEMAVNAYRYMMSLAALLYQSDALDAFADHLKAPDNVFIGDDFLQ